MSVAVEFMVPRGPEAAARIKGFYADIGWLATEGADDPNDIFVQPQLDGVPDLPVLSYWQTKSPTKRSQFKWSDVERPSRYAAGLVLPRMQELVEVCLVVPDNDAVHRIFEAGGDLLRDHSHVQPREHAGRQEFRFSDPFRYALRVCAPVPDRAVTG